MTNHKQTGEVELLRLIEEMILTDEENRWWWERYHAWVSRPDNEKSKEENQ